MAANGGEGHTEARQSEAESCFPEGVLKQLGLGGVEELARGEDAVKRDSANTPPHDKSQGGGVVAIGAVSQ